MLDLLEHYIYDSLPREDFATSPGLRRKVGPEGELLPFYGCTAVFWLPEAAREAVAGLQARLYSAAGRLLAQPLEPGTFHMTLPARSWSRCWSAGAAGRRSGCAPPACSTW